jgi:intracellular sulfur oxidation DsrE/DsrF family protein
MPGCQGLLYAGNVLEADKAAYQLADADHAMVVTLRHFATVFAYNDTIWAKYGKAFSDLLKFTDPKTNAAPSTNLMNAADYGMMLPNFGTTIDSLVRRGVQFAVCDMATSFIAGQLAAGVKGDAKTIHDELAANLVPNSHLVSAGVIAVTRAQEYGYSLLTTL